MTDRTADQLVNEVAGILGKLTPGEALSDEDHTTIDNCIDPVLAEVDDIVSVSRDNIPERYFQTLARLVAVHAAPKYSNAPVDLAQVQIHEQRLRFLSVNGPTYQPVRAEYF